MALSGREGPTCQVPLRWLWTQAQTLAERKSGFLIPWKVKPDEAQLPTAPSLSATRHGDGALLRKHPLSLQRPGTKIAQGLCSLGFSKQLKPKLPLLCSQTRRTHHQKPQSILAQVLRPHLVWSTPLTFERSNQAKD